MCEDGHILQGYVQESTESQDGSKYATRTRKTRLNRVRKLRSAYNKNDHFHGARGDFLKWQTIQFVLRQQLKVLIDDHGFPPELELVVRDLWSMLITGAGLVDAPNEYYTGEEGPDSFSGSKEGWVSNKTRDMGQRKRKKEEEQEEEAESEEQSEDEEERRKREDANSSSESDDELESSRPVPPAPDDASPQPPARKRSRNAPNDKRSQSVKVGQESDSPAERINISFTLVILYLGCCTLRLPVFFSDILKSVLRSFFFTCDSSDVCRMAETHQIMYLDARNFLPTEMRNHLNQFDQKALSPSVSLPANCSAHPLNSMHQVVAASSRMPRDKEDFTYWIARFVKMYEQDWNVRFPEANLPLISWRICKTLGLSRAPVPPLLVRSADFCSQLSFTLRSERCSRSCRQ